jgi:KDO2-lipid IV(A) lauroyltransferase
MFIVYYLLVYPLSFLPLRVLFGLSDFFFAVLYWIIGYRKKLVRSNIANAFPSLDANARARIERDFYRHFCDVIVESIQLFKMSYAALEKRCDFINLELIEKYYKEGRSFILVAGHYGNWELVATALNPKIPHPLIAIYKPLSNKFIDEKMRQSRSKFGLSLVPKKIFKETIESYQAQPHALIFANDQAPSKSQKAHWMTFLHQDTAVQVGTEVYAKRYNYVVIMGKIKKVKRGYYQFSFELITENPNDKKEMEITEQHTRILEQQILEAPAYWLWTHRRWKNKRNENDNL